MDSYMRFLLFLTHYCYTLGLTLFIVGFCYGSGFSENFELVFVFSTLCIFVTDVTNDVREVKTNYICVRG